MKKIISVLVIVAMVLSMTSTIFADVKPISIKVDGKVITIPDGAPYVNEDGRTMVPIRFVSENLGCEVNWEAGTVTIQNKTIKIAFAIGEYNAQVTKLSDNVTRLAVVDTKSVLKDGRTMVPVRFISEVFDAKVDWDGALSQVSILSTGNYTKPQQPKYYNRLYTGGSSKRLLYDPEVPFEVEYFSITKEEVENNAILKALSQLPNFTYITIQDNNNDGTPIYHFLFQEINPYNYNRLDTVFCVDLYSGLRGFSFWVDRDNALTLGLLRNTLSILYKDDTALQDTIYRQVLKQKTASLCINNLSLKNYTVFTNLTRTSLWESEAFNVWGSVNRKE